MQNYKSFNVTHQLDQVNSDSFMLNVKLEGTSLSGSWISCFAARQKVTPQLADPSV